MIVPKEKSLDGRGGLLPFGFVKDRLGTCKGHVRDM